MRECYATDGTYKLYLLAEEDRENYTELHRQTNGENTLFRNPLCKDIMWEQTLSGQEEIYSIFDEKGQYCGSVEFQSPNTRHPEIGIDLLENMRNKGIGLKAIKIAARKFLELHDVEYFVVKISSQNSHSIHVFEKMGLSFIGEEESPYARLMKRLKEFACNEGRNNMESKENDSDMKNSENEVVKIFRLEKEKIL